jgi:hypothetical protein
MGRDSAIAKRKGKIRFVKSVIPQVLNDPYRVFGKLIAETKDISTALPLYKRHRVIEPLLIGVFRAAQ